MREELGSPDSLDYLHPGSDPALGFRLLSTGHLDGPPKAARPELGLQGQQAREWSQGSRPHPAWRDLSAPTVPGCALLQARQGLRGRRPWRTQREDKLAPLVLKKFQANSEPKRETAAVPRGAN